jgi:hypothetical protein
LAIGRTPASLPRDCWLTACAWVTHAQCAACVNDCQSRVLSV